MQYHYIIIIVVQLLLKEGSYAYRDGASTNSCSDLTPGHGAQQNGNNPFTVTATTKDQPDELEVTISSSDSTDFQGFILQAREDGSNTPKGTFGTPPQNARHMTCTKSMVRSRLQIKI